MHGRKKPTQPRSEGETTALQKKTFALSATISLILEKKKENDVSDETLELTGKVLRNLTDFYSIWNFRRRILLSKNQEIADLEAAGLMGECGVSPKIVATDLVQRELQLSEDSIRKNPKSCEYTGVYLVLQTQLLHSLILLCHCICLSFCLFPDVTIDGAWHHRLWILQRFQVDYDNEIQLCKLLLMEDQRNFHCWCYRRSVVTIGGISAAEEFAYSTEKIEENFSNYSAFHHRSVFIRWIEQECSGNACSSGIASEERRRLVEDEFSLVENAVYTEPDDQSAWWYHQFLLSWTLQQCQATSSSSSSSWSAENEEGTGDDDDRWKWYGSVLQRQVVVIRELLAVEPDSKWAMSALTMLLTSLLALFAGTVKLSSSLTSTPLSISCVGDGSLDEQELQAERKHLLERLCEVDSDHANRYRHFLSKNNS